VEQALLKVLQPASVGCFLALLSGGGRWTRTNAGKGITPVVYPRRKTSLDPRSVLLLGFVASWGKGAIFR